MSLGLPIEAPPKAMTIAGSDSGAGAGIQADLKTFAALGVYGTSVLTAITAQNTRAVLAIAEVPEEVIALQIDGVLEDIGASAVKTGMLSSASIIEIVADRLEAWGIPTGRRSCYGRQKWRCIAPGERHSLRLNNFSRRPGGHSQLPEAEVLQA